MSGKLIFQTAFVTALLVAASARADQARLIEGLDLVFDRGQIRSQSFEPAPRLDSDPEILKSFRGNGPGEERLRVIERADIDLKASTGLFKARIVQMKLLFTPQAAPYSGAITVDARCLSQTKLQERVRDEKAQRSVVFLLNATDSFVYGTCLKEQETYSSQYLLLYCKRQRKFYELKFFTRNKDILSENSVARCL